LVVILESIAISRARTGHNGINIKIGVSVMEWASYQESQLKFLIPKYRFRRTFCVLKKRMAGTKEAKKGYKKKSNYPELMKTRQIDLFKQSAF
jgi:hypothetical protein